MIHSISHTPRVRFHRDHHVQEPLSLSTMFYTSPVAVGCSCFLLYCMLPKIVFYAALIFFSVPAARVHYENLYKWACDVLQQSSSSRGHTSYNQSLPSLIVSTRPFVANATRVVYDTAVWAICCATRYSRDILQSVEEANRQFDRQQQQRERIPRASVRSGHMSSRSSSIKKSLKGSLHRHRANSSPRILSRDSSVTRLPIASSPGSTGLRSSSSGSRSSSSASRSSSGSAWSPEIPWSGKDNYQPESTNGFYVPSDKILDPAHYAVVEPLPTSTIQAEIPRRAASDAKAGILKASRHHSLSGTSLRKQYVDVYR